VKCEVATRGQLSIWNKCAWSLSGFIVYLMRLSMVAERGYSKVNSAVSTVYSGAFSERTLVIVSFHHSIIPADHVYED